jgi:hypothetical protein
VTVTEHLNGLLAEVLSSAKPKIRTRVVLSFSKTRPDLNKDTAPGVYTVDYDNGILTSFTAADV